MTATGRRPPGRTGLRASRTISPRTSLITSRPVARLTGQGRARLISPTISRRIARRTGRGTSRLISLRTDLRIIRPIRVDSV
ncbi:MAG: hypothetical protein IJB29_06730 [Mailhella sp.]|nr:hypothetical protein [Mailhella sp.]